MTRNQILIVLGIFLVAGIFVTGCTQAPPAAPVTTVPETTAAPSPSAQGTPSVMPSMANPASVNCGSIGGMTEIRKDDSGNEYGMCTFANGTSCEEWALFRGEGCKAYAPANATAPASSGIANPASVNCDRIGGTTEIKKNPDGSEYGMCTFPNCTSCEEWALFRGEGCRPGNATAASP